MNHFTSDAKNRPCNHCHVSKPPTEYRMLSTGKRARTCVACLQPTTASEIRTHLCGMTDCTYAGTSTKTLALHRSRAHGIVGAANRARFGFTDADSARIEALRSRIVRGGNMDSDAALTMLGILRGAA